MPAMTPGPVRRFFADRGPLLADIALATLGAIATGRHLTKAFARAPGDIEDLTRDLRISDFESFYRCALRMHHDLPMYFTDSEQVLEQPSKQAPFFELLFQPFVSLVPFGAPVAIVVFGVACIAMLLHSLRLVRSLLADAPGATGPARWAPYVAVVLLLPTLHLNLLYFQTGVLLVWTFLLGVATWRRRPLLAGVVWSLGISIKVVPIVFLVWLAWRRQWRAVAGIVLGLVAANGAVLAYTGIDRGVEQYRGYVLMLSSDPAFAEYNERYQGLPSAIRATLTPKYESRIESSAQQRDWDGVRNFLGHGPLAAHADAIVAAAIALVLAVCAFACRGAPLDGWRLLREGCLVAIAMLLVSPHTWRHYYWWLWPTAAVAVQQAGRRQPWAIAIVAVITVAELLPHRGTIGRLASAWQVFHGPALGATIVFTILATHLIRTRRTPLPPA